MPKELATDAGSGVSISGKHYRDGRHSLRWDYVSASFLQFNVPIPFRPFAEGEGSQKRDTFAVWIYNEKPVQGKLIFEFGKDGQTACRFPFYLDFQGWRTAWVAYERDMEGKARPGMNRLTIHAPEGVQPGTLYIDQLILSAPVDPRHHIRDAQVPFVNMGADHRANSHWSSLYRFFELRPGIRPDPEAIFCGEREALRLIRERFGSALRPAAQQASLAMDELRRTFANFGLVRHEQFILGPTVTYPHYDDIYPPACKDELKSLTRKIDVKAYARFMRTVAEACFLSGEATVRRELADMFITLVEHMRDQGWASGSGLGTLHHLGYNIRDYYPAMFLMRGQLEESGLLELVVQDMYWFSGVGRIFVDSAETSGGIIDIFNTTLEGMLACILMLGDEAEQIRHLHQLSEWISRFLLPAPGLMSCFKVDGSAFHHAGHYPAYAIGGFLGVAPVLYYLSGTPFRIAEEAHASLRKSLLAMRLYCNKTQWLLSLSARHPTGEGELATEPFQYVAMAGSPDGTETVDREVASAYLRLLAGKAAGEAANRFRAMGIEPEPDPSGHWTMNYAALSIHRRDRWLIGARGHSRYLWGNESYVSANLYGRYITYGHVQIVGSGDPVNNRDSGFVHDGWNWNRWPGTTVIHLPLDRLRSNVCNVDTFSGFEEMLISDESYAGGAAIGGKQGMFAMKLHEHPKYNGSHRARKSVFFFDDRVVLLGTDIENDCAEHPTETTLFQSYLKEREQPVWTRGTGAVTEFPYLLSDNGGEPTWIVDNTGNGYYIPAGQRLRLSRCPQHSRSQNKGEPTAGNFVSAWMDHGYAPTNGQYEYAIRIGASALDMQQFAERMSRPETAVYKVLQKDRQAHIVEDGATGTTGYALFEANDRLNTGSILANDTPCMAMTLPVQDGLLLSVVDPDLRLYAGIDASQYGDDGERKEVSVYSREWIANESVTSRIRITVCGSWQLRDHSDRCRIAAKDECQTVLEFSLRDGLPVEVTLSDCKLSE